MPSKLYRLTIIAASLAASTSAVAQTRPDAKGSVLPQVEIKAAAGAYDARRDDTATKIVVGRDEILKFGDTSVLDVLKRLPGVTVVSSGPRGGGEIRMRGLGSGYTQVLVDGQRMAAGYTAESIAPENIERIEIIRAATAELSTQAIAGTINIVLRKIVKTAQRDLTLRAAAGEGGGVSPGFNVQVADRRDKLSYSIAANGSRNNFQRTSPITEVFNKPDGELTLLRPHSFTDDGHFSRLGLQPRLNWALPGGETLSWNSRLNLFNFVRNNYDSSTALIGSPSAFPYVAERKNQRGHVFNTDLSWAGKLSSGAKVDVKVGAFTGRQREADRHLGYQSREGAQLTRDTVALYDRESGYSSTGKVAQSLGEGHALAAGWDAGADRRNIARRENALAEELYGAQVRRLAVFAQDEWNVTHNWSVYAGARWEGISTLSSGNSFAPVRSRSSVLSPILQTLYKIPGAKGDQLRFALARTYRPPGTFSLMPRRSKTLNNSATELEFAGNPDLRPELALGFDTAYEHYWAEGAMVSISASMREIDDVMRAATRQDAAGGWYSLPINDGKARTRGLEFEAKFPLKSIINSAPALDVRVSLARNWSSVDAVSGPNNRLAQQTPFSGSVGVDYKTGRLTTGASYAFRNGGPVRISENEATYVSVRRDLEAYALWKFDARNQLRVTLTNLLGEDKFDERIYSDSNGVERRIAVYPNGVNLRLALELKY